jgi:hypothetical protein
MKYKPKRKKKKNTNSRLLIKLVNLTEFSSSHLKNNFFSYIATTNKKENWIEDILDIFSLNVVKTIEFTYKIVQCKKLLMFEMEWVIICAILKS